MAILNKGDSKIMSKANEIHNRNIKSVEIKRTPIPSEQTFLNEERLIAYLGNDSSHLIPDDVDLPTFETYFDQSANMWLRYPKGSCLKFCEGAGENTGIDYFVYEHDQLLPVKLTKSLDASGAIFYEAEVNGHKLCLLNELSLTPRDFDKSKLHEIRLTAFATQINNISRAGSGSTSGLISRFKSLQSLGISGANPNEYSIKAIVAKKENPLVYLSHRFDPYIIEIINPSGRISLPLVIAFTTPSTAQTKKYDNLAPGDIVDCNLSLQGYINE